MSMSAYASTTAALKSLRAFSYDVASVSTEVMMGPLFDALKTSGIQESSIDVLDTVIVPNLRCMLRQEREGEIRARGDIFDVLFAVWSSHLVGKDGKPLLEPVDPFSRRAKWSLSTEIFTELLSQCEMQDVLYDRMSRATEAVREAVIKAFGECQNNKEIVRELTVVISSDVAHDPHKDTESLKKASETAINPSTPDLHESDSKLVPEVSEIESLMDDLVMEKDAAVVKEKLKAVSQDDTMRIIPTLLCSERFSSFRNTMLSQQTSNSQTAERDTVTALNRITSSAHVSVSSRMISKLAKGLVWPILVAPDVVYRRLFHTAITHSSQASILLETLRLVPSFVKAKHENSTPHILNHFADFLRTIPQELSTTQTLDIVSFICEEFFARKSDRAHLLNPQEGVLSIVLPFLTAEHLSEPCNGPFHRAHFALCVLKCIIVQDGETNVEVVAQTFPEGILLGLLRIMEWCDAENATSTLVLSTHLASEISESLAQYLVKNPPPQETISSFRAMDEITRCEVRWDLRLLVEPVLHLFRTDVLQAPVPPSLSSKDAVKITEDILRFYRIGKSDDTSLVALLETLQEAEMSAAEFRQSLLIGCVLVLPGASMEEFERISRIAIPTLLKARKIIDDVGDGNVTIPSLVMDILSHSVMFALKESSDKALMICRHFTHLVSALISDTKATIPPCRQSRAIPRDAFTCICDILRVLVDSVQFSHQKACEVLLTSCALVNLQSLHTSHSHTRWALDRVRDTLPKGCAPRSQLEAALAQRRTAVH